MFFDQDRAQFSEPFTRMPCNHELIRIRAPRVRNGNAIPDFDSSARERLPQWRFGAARDFAVAWNFQLKRLHMILKSRHVLQSSKAQNRPAAHAGFCPFGSIAAAAALSNAMPISARKPAE